MLTVFIYMNAEAPENNKGACYHFASNQPGCHTYKASLYCSIYRCIKPKDCNAKGVLACGPVSDADKTEILDLHNKYRQEVNID